MGVIDNTLKGYEGDIAKLQGKLREARARQNAIAARFESAVTRARTREIMNGSRTEDAFSVHGARSLLVAKFVPGFSTAAPPLAGIVRMPLLRFVVFTGLGGLIWAGVFIGVGWVFSRQLEVAADYVARLGSSAVALLVAALGGYVAWKYVARQRFLRRIRIARITPEDLKAKLDAGNDVMIVDLRARIDFDADPSIIPGALHLMTEELEARHREIPRDRDIVLYCT